MEFTPRAMRRKDRATSEAETLALLRRAEYGTLATCGNDGWPLSTPISFILLDGQLYFHSAKRGHKLDNLRENPRACFSAVGATRPVYDSDPTTYYESAVVHGEVFVVEEEAEKRRVLVALCQKYLPDDMEKIMPGLEKSLPVTQVFGLSMLRASGKAKAPNPAV